MSAEEQSTTPVPTTGTSVPSVGASSLVSTVPPVNPSPLIRNVLQSTTDDRRLNQPLGNASNHDSNESFHTAASSNPNPSQTILETNAEDVSIPHEGIIDVEDEVEYENDFLYEDTADREQQQGEFWEYQRVVAKETIEKYVEDGKSVTIGNRQVQKTWTHVTKIEGDEPVDYKNIGVVIKPIIN